eukprot:s16472_g1.t1
MPMTTAAWCTNPLLQHQLHPDTATPRVAAPPTRRTEVTPHIRLPRSFAEAPPPRGIWSDPALNQNQPQEPMRRPLPYHNLTLQTSGCWTWSTRIARALLLNSLNETLEFLDNLRTYVEDME